MKLISRIICAATLCLAQSVSAQKVTFTSAALDVEAFNFKTEAMQDGLYSVWGQTEENQMFFPVYLPAADKSYTLDISLQNGCPMVENDNNNKALSAFDLITYTQGRAYWLEGATWSAGQIKDYLKGYLQAADSIIAVYQPVEPVQQYIRLWAYLHTFNEFDSMPNVTRKKPADIGLAMTDVLVRPEEMLNQPLAPYFSFAPYVVARTLPAGSYEERIAYLEANYPNEQLRAKVTPMLQKRKTAPKGMPFPEDITLVDVEGNKVDFAQFRGKYVYVDMWASWCGPCCKEVPFLQEMEKSLDNPDVVFVSVSLDSTEQPWKAKMEQLNMHGNQFLNADGALAKALYVTSIPQFLIFDKEGRLYMTGAPRPSHPSTILMLRDLH